MKIAFIGLGIMGRPMAGHLIAAGHKLAVFDKAAIPEELIGAGATLVDSSAAAARGADVVIVMVPDTPHVEAVLFGQDGVATGLSSGTVVVDMSSISPIATSPAGQRTWMRLPRRSRVGRRGRRQGGKSNDHGGRPAGCIRSRSSAV
jgi:2-hydroxy-3-oxopropionate reductase